MSIEKIEEYLGVSINIGARKDEVEDRRKKYGENKLAKEKKLADLMIFLSQFKNPLVYILLIAFFVTLALNDFIDATVIFIAVFINAILGFFQEKKASGILQILRKAVDPMVITIRDGSPRKIKASEVVVGDVIILKEGDRVPADMRLAKADNFKTNEAVLTGESWPVEKNTDILASDTPVFDRKNMTFLGTAVTEGGAIGIVVAVGRATEFGKIAEQISEIKEEETPLQKKIRKFSYLLAVFISFVVALIFIAGMIAGQDFLDIFLTSIALAVASIPEGLPIGVSVVLAVGMQRILKNKGLVRKLNSVETLGSATVICMDKTGTLTEGQMGVGYIFAGGSEAMKQGGEFKFLDGKYFIGAEQILAIKIGSLVSDVIVEYDLEQKLKNRIFHGDPLEQAIVSMLYDIGLDKFDLEKEQPKLKHFGFNPVRKYAASIHQLPFSQKIFYVMGAPEEVLALSSKIEINGKQNDFTKDFRDLVETKLSESAKKGFRMVGVGYRLLTDNDDYMEMNIKDGANGLVFVGLIGLSDPLRGDVRETLSIAQRAGLKPVIITGDHKSTAEAIAREAGFVFGDENILEGRDLDKISDDQLKRIVDDITIYARTIPQHKFRIVEAWQSRGEVVAMTGDGVNDAPALKKADIGIALGSGTEVAKQASDLVLLDDNFKVIISAIRQGRIIFDNIKKVIVFILKDAFTEVNLIALSLIFKLPLPLLPAQILWVNLFQDSLPAFAFAMEPGEEEVMSEKPKKRARSLLDKEMRILIFIYGISSDLILFSLFILLNKYGSDIAHTRTLIFMLLALESLSGIFSLKSLRKSIFKIDIFSNKYLVLSVLVGFMLMLAAVYFEPLQKILRTTPLDLADWAIVFVFAIFNIVFIEVIKLFFRNKGKK